MCVYVWNGCSPRAAMLIRSLAWRAPAQKRHPSPTPLPGTTSEHSKSQALLPCKLWSRGARAHRAARHATSAAVVACSLAHCHGAARLLAAKSHRTRTATARRGLAAQRPRRARRATSPCTPPRPRSISSSSSSSRRMRRVDYPLPPRFYKYLASCSAMAIDQPISLRPSHNPLRAVVVVVACDLSTIAGRVADDGHGEG